MGAALLSLPPVSLTRKSHTLLIYFHLNLYFIPPPHHKNRSMSGADMTRGAFPQESIDIRHPQKQMGCLFVQGETATLLKISSQNN